MTLGELNVLGRDRFVSVLSRIFEQSPWVAERAWQHRPFTGLDHLHAAMVTEVESAGHAAQLRLLQAHPDLGARVELSALSAAEQCGAGLDRLTASTRDRLRQLTAAYRAKFGFPFLIALRGCSAPDVVDDVILAIERRLPASPDEERREALSQVYRIAAFRLDDVAADRGLDGEGAPA